MEDLNLVLTHLGWLQGATKLEIQLTSEQAFNLPVLTSIVVKYCVCRLFTSTQYTIYSTQALTQCAMFSM